MRNPFRYRLCLVAPTDDTAPERKDVTEVVPPPYEECPQVETVISLPSCTLPSYQVLALKRCLTWRMAIDWGLERHVTELERPSNFEYSTFEKNCKVFGAVLGNRYVDPQRAERHLSTYVFEPADRIGLEKNLLEFFIFSVRRATRLNLKRISSCRNAMMLGRLVLDSQILVDLVTNPGSTFARKLKAKCADLHRKNFSWLLEPAYISLEESVKARATDIYSTDWNDSGRWKESELLMRECMRPCAALMNPFLALSTMYEVDRSYLEPDANLRQQAGFYLCPFRIYKNLLPAAIVCGPVAWLNYDTISWDELETGGIPKE